MAHSFIQAYDEEVEAFEQFAHAQPDNVILLIDTYDTEAAARKGVKLVSYLRGDGVAVEGIRIDRSK